ncbi:MAG: MFS transporter [Oligoflexia bacterium]|nr:MFS transporter [Oligoflexia bacterium]
MTQNHLENKKNKTMFLTGMLGFALFTLSKGLAYVAVLVLLARTDITSAISSSIVFVLLEKLGRLVGSSLTFRFNHLLSYHHQATLSYLIHIGSLAALIFSINNIVSVSILSLLLGLSDSIFRIIQRSYSHNLWIDETRVSFGTVTIISWGIGISAGPILCVLLNATTFAIALLLSLVGFILFYINLKSFNQNNISEIANSPEKGENINDHKVKNISKIPYKEFLSFKGYVLMTGSFIVGLVVILLNSSLVSLSQKSFGLTESQLSIVYVLLIIGGIVNGVIFKKKYFSSIFERHYGWVLITTMALISLAIVYFSTSKTLLVFFLIFTGMFNGISIDQLMTYVRTNFTEEIIANVHSINEFFTVIAGLLSYLVLKVSNNNYLILEIIFVIFVIYIISIFYYQNSFRAKEKRQKLAY